MSKLSLARYGLFALACAVVGGIFLLHFGWVAHDPAKPDLTHPDQLFFDPQAYVTQTQAIVGYGLFFAAFVLSLPLMALTFIELRQRRLGK